MTGKCVSLLAAVAVALPCPPVFAQQNEPNPDEKHRVVIETDTGRYGVGAEKLELKQLGVAIYPGAKLAKNQDNDSKDNGASLFLDWGKDSTHLYVQKFVSSDSAEKIVSFYRQQLSRYGAVLECRGGKPVSTNAVKGKCNQVDDDKDIELRAGTETKQHIVGLTPTASGTEFAIVYLDHAKATKE